MRVRFPIGIACCDCEGVGIGEHAPCWDCVALAKGAREGFSTVSAVCDRRNATQWKRSLRSEGGVEWSGGKADESVVARGRTVPIAVAGIGSVRRVGGVNERKRLRKPSNCDVVGTLLLERHAVRWRKSVDRDLFCER
jgi:hypothetical protein